MTELPCVTVIVPGSGALVGRGGGTGRTPAPSPGDDDDNNKDVAAGRGNILP